MNSLSWLIYLGSVADDAQGLAIMALFFGVPTTIAAGVFAICKPVGTIWSWDNADEKRKAADDRAVVAQRILKRSVIAVAVAAFMVIALPSKDTVYAIAASQMGEQALKSETGGKAVKALDAWLDRQITPAKP